jgi:Integrase core domain
MVPFYDEHGIRLSRMLTDRGTEFRGTQSHEYELYLAVADIDHSRTKTKSPQTNGICERFHRTSLDEFYRVALRKTIYRTLDELQPDLDTWLVDYNYRRPNQGRWCFGKTPMRPFLDALPWQRETRGCLTTNETHIASNNQHRLSGQVSTNTHHCLASVTTISIDVPAAVARRLFKACSCRGGADGID